MNSYWGGAVAAAGGALVLGALPRILRRTRRRDALLLGLGVVILANSRPFEGLLLSVPVAAALLIWMFGRSYPPAKELIKNVVLPVCLVLAVGGSAMGFYFWRVTGSPLEMPYQVDQKTYGQPVFLWQRPAPEPVFRHDVIRDFYLWGLAAHERTRSVRGALAAALAKQERRGCFSLVRS